MHIEGHVLLNGHTLPIAGIKVEADEDDLDNVWGNNCVDIIRSHRKHDVNMFRSRNIFLGYDLRFQQTRQNKYDLLKCQYIGPVLLSEYITTQL